MDLPFTIPDYPVSRIAGITAITMGIIALFFPVFTFHMIDWFFALFVIIVSISLIRKGISLVTGTGCSRVVSLLFGGIGLVGGIAIVVFPGLVTFVAKDIIAICAILMGIAMVVNVFTSVVRLERIFSAVTGLLMISAGLLILFIPVIVSNEILVIVLGFFAIGIGILVILFGSAEQSPKKEINHLIYK